MRWVSTSISFHDKKTIIIILTRAKQIFSKNNNKKNVFILLHSISFKSNMLSFKCFSFLIYNKTHHLSSTTLITITFMILYNLSCVVLCGYIMMIIIIIIIYETQHQHFSQFPFYINIWSHHKNMYIINVKYW